MDDNEIINRGKMWEEFGNTLFGMDLNAFFDEQEKDGKDTVLQCIMAGEYEEAKAAGHKLSGILAVKTYIQECIMTKNELTENKKAERQRNKDVPSHVY